MASQLRNVYRLGIIYLDIYAAKNSVKFLSASLRSVCIYDAIAVFFRAFCHANLLIHARRRLYAIHQQPYTHS